MALFNIPVATLGDIEDNWKAELPNLMHLIGNSALDVNGTDTSLQDDKGVTHKLLCKVMAEEMVQNAI